MENVCPPETPASSKLRGPLCCTIFYLHVGNLTFLPSTSDLWTRIGGWLSVFIITKLPCPLKPPILGKFDPNRWWLPMDFAKMESRFLLGLTFWAKSMRGGLQLSSTKWPSQSADYPPLKLSLACNAYPPYHFWALIYHLNFTKLANNSIIYLCLVGTKLHTTWSKLIIGICS